MNRKCWFIPALIVAINAVVITMRWDYLSEVVPAHFDLQGNAGGSMSRSILMLYPMIGAAVCLATYMIARKKHELQTGLVILTSGLSLVLLSSTMVTLTSGTMPIFMLAEPVILLAAVVGFVFCIVKSRKKNK